VLPRGQHFHRKTQKLLGPGNSGAVILQGPKMDQIFGGFIFSENHLDFVQKYITNNSFTKYFPTILHRESLEKQENRTL
jgi:hypothetical protein